MSDKYLRIEKIYLTGVDNLNKLLNVLLMDMVIMQ